MNSGVFLLNDQTYIIQYEGCLQRRILGPGEEDLYGLSLECGKIC